MYDFEQLITYFGGAMIIAVAGASLLDLIRKRGRSIFNSLSVFVDTIVTILFISFFMFTVYTAIF
tara:strand:+ start:544 stop:738 length:195 start_codon:yes stop_codon:yes gene_type:complete